MLKKHHFKQIMEFQDFEKKGEIMDNRPIGVMDSGLGGLSVVRIIQQKLPHETVVFVGDQGHFPYGTKSQAEVQRLALSIGRFLVQQHAKLMVVACNTATAAALTALQASLPIPVIGVIQPGAQAALKLGKGCRIGVIATDSTTKDGAYEHVLHQLDPQATVISRAAQPLVSVVEHHQVGTPKAQAMVNQQLQEFVDQPVDSLILGCTHFPFLVNEIRHTLGSQVNLIDPALATVDQVALTLEKDELAAAPSAQAKLQLFSTGNVIDLQTGADQWLNGSKYECSHLTLSE